MDSYLRVLDDDIQAHEEYLEYQATLPTNAEEYDAYMDSLEKRGDAA